MVACDGCDQWFHFKCVNTNKAQVRERVTACDRTQPASA